MNYIYPIRKSRSFWSIPLMCYHACSEFNCSKQIQYKQIDGNLCIQMSDNIDYADGVCSKNGLLYDAFIPLVSYDIAKPRGHVGDLCNPDMVIINDLTFSIKISYPIRTPIIKQINTTHPVTIRELVHIIKLIYQDIYRLELETATPTTFKMEKKCEECKFIIAEIPSNSVETDVCSICYNNLQTEETISQCHCSHRFHHGCIKSWIDTGRGKACPLCRQLLSHCDDCQGVGTVKFEYVGIVVPLELREMPQYRNRTNGVFGIYMTDYENLVLRGLVYNRVQRMVYINI